MVTMSPSFRRLLLYTAAQCPPKHKKTGQLRAENRPQHTPIQQRTESNTNQARAELRTGKLCKACSTPKWTGPGRARTGFGQASRLAWMDAMDERLSGQHRWAASMDGVDGLHRCRHGGDKPVEELHVSWAVISYIYLLCPYPVSCYRLPKSPTMIPPRERRKDEPIKKTDRMRQRGRKETCMCM